MKQEQIEEVGQILLENAYKYDGEEEVEPSKALINLLNRTGRIWSVTGDGGGSGGKFNITKDGWCSDFVAGNNDECGFGMHIGRASGWSEFGYKILDKDLWYIPGVIIVFESHVAYRDYEKAKIFGGNQSQKVCSQLEKYYGIPKAAVIPIPTKIRLEPEEPIEAGDSATKLIANFIEGFMEVQEADSEAADAIIDQLKSLNIHANGIKQELQSIKELLLNSKNTLETLTEKKSKRGRF